MEHAYLARRTGPIVGKENRLVQMIDSATRRWGQCATLSTETISRERKTTSMVNKPSSQRECPECGGDTVWADNHEELVCTECGLVLEEGENNREDKDIRSSDGEWTAFAPTEGSQNIDDNQTKIPETVAEWQKWYPCPACGSVSFKQTETVTVYGSEDGNYGGDDADFVERIMCAECEVVLESE